MPEFNAIYSKIARQNMLDELENEKELEKRRNRLTEMAQ